jgi:integrase
MTGHVRKRGARWEVILELGDQAARRCAPCRKRYWKDREEADTCPKCGGALEDVVARRQIILPERFATKKEAQTRLTRELNASLEGVFTEPDKITVKEFLEDHWLPTIKGMNTIKPTTKIAYTLHVKQRIVPVIGHIRLQKLTTKDIDALYTKLTTEPGPRGKPLSPASCRAMASCLGRALDKAVKWNLITRNPADGADKPQLTRPKMKTWTREELSTFLALTEADRLYPLWRVLAMTGMRRGEALGLRWSDVDMESGTLSIQRSRTQAGYEAVEQDTKTGRSRVVALDAETVAALRRQSEQQLQDAANWRGDWVEGGHVFTRENGTPWQPDRITKLFGQAVSASGLKRIRLHDLRHTHATLALQAGIHPKVVAERLGHAKASMTLDTYSHVIPVLQESAAQLVAALVDAPAAR